MIESFIFKEILNGNNLIIALGLYALYKMHGQAMKKLDDVIESNHEIKETIAIHGVKIEFIEDLKKWNERQDKKIEELRAEMYATRK